MLADKVLMIVASLLLLFGNWLAFHDFREAHTGRDWLTLFASVLVMIQFLRAFSSGNLRRRS